MTALPNMGDAALDIITAWHYDYNHDSALNKAFVRDFAADNKVNPNFFAVGGYDGMHLIYEALKKTGGKTDGESLDQRRQGHGVGEPAGPDLHRPGDARHHPDHLHPARREGRRATWSTWSSTRSRTSRTR